MHDFQYQNDTLYCEDVAVPTVAEAVRGAVMAARTDLAEADVLVTGSLYTVAEARQYLLH